MRSVFEGADRTSVSHDSDRRARRSNTALLLSRAQIWRTGSVWTRFAWCDGEARRSIGVREKMMAGGAVQQNGIFSNPHHHNQQPHMESDPPDSRKRPLETPTEASSTKRTNTGGKRTHRRKEGLPGSTSRCLFTLPWWRDRERETERGYILNILILDSHQQNKIMQDVN